MSVLDASAMLAFLFEETGAELVTEHLPTGIMSTVNLSEVLGRFARDGHEVHPIRDKLFASSIEWVPFEAPHATLAAGLLPITKHLGLSFADRACIALATARNMSVVTADRVWSELDLDIPVISIR